jgi:hypothetical protein
MFSAGLIGCESSSDSASGSGIGGSTARFTVQNNFLVVVENNLITSFSLQDPMNPEKKDVIHGSDGDLETIFPFDDGLIFIGSQTGSVIIRIHEESGEDDMGNFFESGDMEIIAQVSHARSCDPVVANETHMYVTIRDGNGCGLWGESNSLIVYDIRELDAPLEVTTRDIYRPFGLALRGNELYVCSEEGLQQFDVEVPGAPRLVASHDTLECNDIIPLEDRLILTGDQGVAQITGFPGEPTVVSRLLKGD